MLGYCYTVGWARVRTYPCTCHRDLAQADPSDDGRKQGRAGFAGGGGRYGVREGCRLIPASVARK